MHPHIDLNALLQKAHTPHHAQYMPGKSFDYEREEGCIGACTGTCKITGTCPFLDCPVGVLQYEEADAPDDSMTLH